MDMRALRYFVAAFETRSVTAAARRCYISQPSVSAAIAAMEDDFRARLFTRHRKGLIPTSSAEALYPRAKRLLDEAAEMRALFAAPAVEEQFTLGLLRSLDIARTTRMLTPLAATPGARLSLVGPDDVCDARIVERRMAEETESFALLWRERYVVALPAHHSMAVAAPIQIDDLRRLTWIARCHCESAALLGEVGDLQVVAVADSEEWALALVGAGLGATIAPEGSIGARQDVVVRPIANRNFTRDIGVASGRERALSPFALDMVEKLKGVAA